MSLFFFFLLAQLSTKSNPSDTKKLFATKTPGEVVGMLTRPPNEYLSTSSRDDVQKLDVDELRKIFTFPAGVLPAMFGRYLRGSGKYIIHLLFYFIYSFLFVCIHICCMLLFFMIPFNI